jgi:hypothetical protein
MSVSQSEPKLAQLISQLTQITPNFYTKTPADIIFAYIDHYIPDTDVSLKKYYLAICLAPDGDFSLVKDFIYTFVCPETDQFDDLLPELERISFQLGLTAITKYFYLRPDLELSGISIEREQQSYKLLTRIDSTNMFFPLTPIEYETYNEAQTALSELISQ